MAGRGLGLGVLLVVAFTQSGAAAPLRLGSVLGETGEAGFARAAAPRPFRFPEDHGPHPEYRSEWWYLTASLEDESGAEYGVQFTLFRQALRPAAVFDSPWDASQLYLGHFALTEVAEGRHREAERLSRGHPRLAGVALAPFEAAVDGWRLTASGDGLEILSLNAAADGFAVDLRLAPQKGVVLQGERGLSAKGPDQASYYYSLPRLAVTGTVRGTGAAASVTGTAWLDREWSTSVLGDAQQGWDWFALQLETGDDLMVFQLRRGSGLRDPYDQGVWVSAAGDARQLRTQDFTLEPLRYWQDGQGVAWPVAWRLQVMGPNGPRQLEVEAALDDQRMDTLFTYWEGLVRVSDETGEVIGSGYMELTGYE